MPAIDNGDRGDTGYRWCRRIRFVPGDLPPVTVVTTASPFQAEMLRYRNMPAYPHSLIQADGEGDGPSRFAQVRAIYAAISGDFAVDGFADYMGIDYVGAFDQRFARPDDEARGHLGALLGRAGELPIHLLAEGLVSSYVPPFVVLVGDRVWAALLDGTDTHEVSTTATPRLLTRSVPRPSSRASPSSRATSSAPPSTPSP